MARKTRKQKGRGQSVSRGIAATGMYDSQFINYIKHGDRENVKRYASYVDVNKKDIYGISPLHYACVFPDPEIIKIIINNGGLVDIRGPENRTPLMQLSRNIYGARSISVVLDKGADINARDIKGRTALMHAIPVSSDIVERLIQRGADVNARDNDGNTPLLRNTNIDNPPHHIDARLLTIAKILIDNGADPAAVDRDGVSVIDKADINNYTNEYLDLIEESLVGSKPEIDLAPHIGELKLNLRNSPVPITLEDFESGKDYVRLKKNSTQLFDQSSLQAWFNTGKHFNPLTRNNIKQNNIERFTYKFNDRSKRKRMPNNGNRKTKRGRPNNGNNNMPPVASF